MSILPLVDEFVVALGKGDDDDQTESLIRSISSEKIKIIPTVWDLEAYPQGMENAHQTDIAKSYCTGDWLFYLQADEVVHEKDLPEIERRCRQLLFDTEVEGLLFRYYHFWGDYWHYHDSHGWYAREIRIIRNDPDIHSWQSAQSFRRIPAFDGKNYRQKQNTFKLKVAAVDAYIYHYGYVRPPDYMFRKKKALDTIHHDTKTVAITPETTDFFDYGPLGQLKIFTGTHPAVMQERISQFDWAQELNYGTSRHHSQKYLHKHEQLKNRILTFIEKHLLWGKRLFEFRNYILLHR